MLNVKQEWCTPPSFSLSLVACPSEDGMSGSLFLVSLSLPDRLSTQNFQEFPPEIANSPGIDHTQRRKRSRKKKVWYGRIISAAESFLGVGSGTRIFRNWLQYKTEFNKNSYWKNLMSLNICVNPLLCFSVRFCRLTIDINFFLRTRQILNQKIILIVSEFFITFMSVRAIW